MSKKNTLYIAAAVIGIILLFRKSGGTPPPPPPPPPMPTTPPFGIIEVDLGYNAVVSLNKRFRTDTTDTLTVGVYAYMNIPRTISVIMRPDGSIDHIDQGSGQDHQRKDHSFTVNKTIEAQKGIWTVFVYGFASTAVTASNFWLGHQGQFLGSATELVS